MKKQTSPAILTASVEQAPVLARKISKKKVAKKAPRKTARLFSAIDEKSYKKVMKKIGKKGIIAKYVRDLVIADITITK